MLGPIVQSHMSSRSEEREEAPTECLNDVVGQSFFVISLIR
jgi:hypothetical protein